MTTADVKTANTEACDGGMRLAAAIDDDGCCQQWRRPIAMAAALEACSGDGQGQWPLRLETCKGDGLCHWHRQGKGGQKWQLPRITIAAATEACNANSEWLTKMAAADDNNGCYHGGLQLQRPTAMAAEACDGGVVL